jgi:type II secretory pathway pseudopilin PulG
VRIQRIQNSAAGDRGIAESGIESIAGFTIIEALVALFIVSMMFGTIIYAYVNANDRAEWSAYSLAAESLAMQGIEQARSAKWDPQAWPVVDDLGVTNYTQIEKLDIPLSGSPVYATNYISVSTISTSPQIRQLRADCVWVLVSRHHGASGPFTNTAVTLRASDQ